MALALIIGRCLTMAVLALAACYLAVNGKDGWGWFLFVAPLICPSFSNGEVDDD